MFSFHGKGVLEKQQSYLRKRSCGFGSVSLYESTLNFLSFGRSARKFSISIEDSCKENFLIEKIRIVRTENNIGG